jgi:hypothetical protein
MQKGLCRNHPELPWTADSMPAGHDLDAMSDICRGCPVRASCAAYAVHSNNDRGIDGGFYAGYWLPWLTYQDSAENKRIRQRSKMWLRVFLGERKPPLLRYN